MFGQGFDPTPIIIVLLIFVAFYFFIIRPERKKQKEHQELIKQLRKGDKVITAGGIYGQIESLSQDSVVIRVESGATMRVARNSIVAKRGK
ncbi:preprotein translocase subunit YajC [Dehalococcoidales bacterium]|nr:preprotein translocase subunit YajC [Dehalococcoidales bacterium]